MLQRGLVGDIKPENWHGLIDAIYAIILTLLLIELPMQIMDVIKEYKLHPNHHLVTLESLTYYVFGYLSIFIIIYDIWAHHREIVSNAVINRVNLSIGIIILFLSSLIPPLHHIVMELKRELLERENSSIGSFSFIYDDVRPLVVGSLLDGIPESIGIGVSFLENGLVPAAIVGAAAIANIPEGLASGVGLKKSHMKTSTIMFIWATVVFICVASAAISFATMHNASDQLKAGIMAFAGGGALAMTLESVVPEAYSETHHWVSILGSAGFAIAFYLANSVS
jgi:zinc transporter ZupT